MYRYIFFTSSYDTIMQGTPMFLKGVTPSSASGFVNLSIVGSHSGTQFGFGSIPLYLNSVALTTNMNMYLLGQPNQTINFDNTIINMFISGDINDFTGSITQLHGAMQSGKKYASFEGRSLNGFINSSIYLYMRGDGTNDGYNPFASSMNLYLQTNPNYSNSINTYIRGKDTINQNITHYMFGVVGLTSSSTNLYLKANNIMINSTPVFIRGYIT